MPAVKAELPPTFGKSLVGGMVVAGRQEYRSRPITVECWAKLNSSKTFNILVASDTKASTEHWELFTLPESGVFSVFQAGRGVICESGVNICDGQWHYLAAILEPKRVRMFVDGTLVKEALAQQPPVEEPVPGDLAFGKLVESDLGCDGLVDNVRLSRGAREIDGMPTGPLTKDADTIDLWDFEEATAASKNASTVSPNPQVAVKPGAVPSLKPTDLTWKLVNSSRSDSAAVLEDRFVDFRDEFESDLRDYTVIGTGGAVSNGVLTSAGSGLYICSTKTPVAPCVGMVLDVAANASGTVSLGLAKDADNSVLGSYDKAAKTIRIDLTANGTKTNLKTVENLDLPTPLKLGVTIVSSTLTVFVYTAEGHWQIICSRWFGNRINLNAESNIQAYKYAFGCSGEMTINSFKAGYAGRVGVRDPWLLHLGNGAPVMDGDWVYLIWANEATYPNDDAKYYTMGKPAFDHSYMAIHKFNTKTYEDVEVSKIFFRRQSKGVLSVLTDNTGGIVWDRDGDGKFYVTASPWGDYPVAGEGVDIQLAVTSENLLSGVHVLDATKLPQYGPCYDPGIIRLDGIWYLCANTATNKSNLWAGRRPATLYKGTDLTNLELVPGDTTSRPNTEGHHFQKIGGVWYALAMEQNGRAFAYDLNMHAVGMVPPLPPAPSGQQPCYIAISDEGRTKYLWVNNDGSRYPYFHPGFGTPSNETRGNILTLIADQELDHEDFKERMTKPAHQSLEH